ncbi:MAG: glycosyltransferase family 4 protein [Phycisphaerae bacterium]|nr:glycosyltransferase family 4 protein [Phycisphaerae bacterium]
MSNQKKTSVCFFSLRAYPLFNPTVKATFGGAEVDLYLIATELAKDDRFDVQFVVGDYGQPEIEQREGVTLIKSLDVNKNMILQGGKIWKALRQADSDIYMHEACSLGTTLVAWFCKVKKRSFVYRTAHTDETHGVYFKRFPVRGLFVKWAFKNTTFLITQNDEDVQSLLSTLRLPSIVIRNGCRISPALPAKNGSILWVARSLPVKRPDLFLELAKQFPEQPFIMVCPQGVGDTQYEQLRQQADTIDNLQFLDYVAFHKIDAYFEQAGIFVCTSDSEGFPNTFVQSCKAATAILSLNVNPDNFLDTYHCGFCADGDWNLFVDTLRRWLQTDTPEQLGRNGQDYIKTHHDLSVIIEQYKDVFLKAKAEVL